MAVAQVTRSRRMRRKSHPKLIKAATDKKMHHGRHGHRRRPEVQRAYRERLAQAAQDTLHTVLSTQSYFEGSSDAALTGAYHDLTAQILHSRQETTFYPHHSALLAGWEKGPSLMMPIPSDSTTHFEFLSTSTLSAAQRLWQAQSTPHASGSGLGVLSCASPKKPGGACLSGGDDQEECLVRQTTLYDSLQKSTAGAQFYAAHKKESDGSGLHDHAMLYSPHVVVFKDERGRRVSPYTINVVSSVPVNAGTVRAKFNIDEEEFDQGIRSVMKERMARILRLFEERGDRVIVLGAFGVGQFRNSPDMVGEIWADLLHAREAKFRGIFEKVVFTVPGKHLSSFENSFNGRCLESEMSAE